MLDIRSHYRNVACKLANRDQEVAEENEQPIELNDEARQRPAEKDEDNPGSERSCPLAFLWTREKDQGLLETDDEGQADEKEDLVRVNRG